MKPIADSANYKTLIHCKMRQNATKCDKMRQNATKCDKMR